MSRIFTSFILSFFIISTGFAQANCTGFTLSNFDIDFSDPAFSFPDLGGGDIVNAATGNRTAGPFSFDILDELTGTAGPGGADDLMISFEMLPTVDLYGGLVEETTSTTHEIDQSSSGLRGTLALGTSGATDATTGDIRCYKITAQFFSHVQVYAKDFNVLVNSLNTAGVAYESAAIEFLRQDGTPYGSATYTGFYQAPPTGVPNGTNPPTVTTAPWTTTGTGVYLADNLNIIDVATDEFAPTGTSNGLLDGFDPNAELNGGLNPTDIVGGMVLTVCFEDVAATLNDGDITTSSTSHTSTLNGFSLDEICFGSSLLGAELVNFEATPQRCATDFSWTTLSESNLQRFYLEQSRDGIAFRTIATIDAQGDEQQATTYSKSLPNSEDVSYFRLRLEDFDSQIQYSKVLAMQGACHL